MNIVECREEGEEEEDTSLLHRALRDNTVIQIDNQHQGGRGWGPGVRKFASVICTGTF